MAADVLDELLMHARGLLALVDGLCAEIDGASAEDSQCAREAASNQRDAIAGIAVQLRALSDPRTAAAADDADRGVAQLDRRLACPA